MKIIIPVLLLTGLSLLVASCKKDGEPPVPLHSWTINVENGRAVGHDTLNLCYINLTDGASYNREGTKVRSDRVDFVYLYIMNGSYHQRWFSNIFSSAMGSDFDSITNSLIEPVSTRGVTESDFQDLETSADVAALLKKCRVDWRYAQPRAIFTLNDQDVPGVTIFAFYTNTRKKGFFKIEPYTPKVTPDQKATITLTVKVEK